MNGIIWQNYYPNIIQSYKDHAMTVNAATDIINNSRVYIWGQNNTIATAIYGRPTQFPKTKQNKIQL